jgi:hypothetical protein
MKNAFNEWQVFCDFDMQKSITNLENEESIKYMVDMLSSFVCCKLQKKMVAYTFQQSIVSYLNF